MLKQLQAKLTATILVSGICANAIGQCISGDCQNGTGAAVITPEIVFAGTFKDGQADGSGIFYNSSFKIYDGQVKKGLYNGKGTLYYQNGSVYIGEFKNGLREGPGEYRTLKGTFKGNFHLNALDGQFMLEDSSNANGIYTVYGQIRNVYMGADKVGVYSGFDFSIYDAHTGKLLEITPIADYAPDRNWLYLDFGTRFFDTIKHKHILPLELNSFVYNGKSILGDPIFSQSTYDGINLITLTADNEIKKMVSIDRDLYVNKKVNSNDQAYVNAVSADLSRAVVNGILVDIRNKKSTVMDGVAYNSTMIFSPGGDSLKINIERQQKLYSALSGKILATIELLPLPGADANFSYGRVSPGNFYLDVRNISSSRCGMILIENIFDKNDVVPLINPDLTYHGASVAYQRALSEEYANSAASNEKYRERYEAEMAYRYGPNWRKGENMRTVDTKSSKPAERQHKCSFCGGSGVINVPGSGTSLEQDRTSGRWYKVVKSDNGQCPMCKGTGYLKL